MSKYSHTLNLSFSVHVCVCACVCAHMHVCMSVRVYACACVWLSLKNSIHRVLHECRRQISRNHWTFLVTRILSRWDCVTLILTFTRLAFNYQHTLIKYNHFFNWSLRFVCTEFISSIFTVYTVNIEHTTYSIYYNIYYNIYCKLFCNSNNNNILV